MTGPIGSYMHVRETMHVREAAQNVAEARKTEEQVEETEQRTEEYEIVDLPVPQESKQDEPFLELDDPFPEFGRAEATKDSGETPFETFNEKQVRLYCEQAREAERLKAVSRAKEVAAQQLEGFDAAVKRVKASQQKEQVVRPSHYDIHSSGLQVIDVIQHLEMSFECGNALKYLCRAGRKDGNPTVQDLRKAIFYLQLEISKLQRSP